MTRIEHIGEQTLILGDCREVMPTLGRFDACVTDPPYGIDYGNAGGFSASNGWTSIHKGITWDIKRPNKKIFIQFIGQTKQQIIWGGNYFTDYLPPSMQWLVWDKAQRGFSLADFEMAWTSNNKASRIFTYGRGNEKGFAPKSKENKEFLSCHPTQKPLEVMRWCLGFVPDAETILDPFMGSGTTLVACQQLGRKGTGIEISEKYFDIACKRVEQAAAQPRLFTEPKQKHKQEAML